jgi:hypothetical protein
MLAGIYTCSSCGAHRTVTEGKAACCGRPMKYASPLPTEERSCCEVH